MSQAQTQQPGGDAPVQIGPYEVLSRLALGGMAELLLARRVGIEGFQKLVVIKRILPQYASLPDFVEMFLHEARLAAALEHPNIVHVSDIGKAGDDFYFAMAYLHGKDVLAILRELSRTKARMPVDAAIAIASGIAAGLHHAHEQIGFDGKPLGIVHRDVSPANAIVTYDGTVKLVDFGIAKAAAQMNQTRAGVRKGKAAYMSPEQCRGDPLDRRTDIWSLGVVLYELLTMTRLHKPDNDLAIMHRIVSSDPPSPRLVAPDLAPSLEAVVMRCLRRDRDERYATAAELQRDLDACAHELGLRPGAAGLSELLRGLFGAPPLPWAPTTAAVPTEPVTHSVDVAAEPFGGASPEVDSTRDLGNTPPPQLDTRIAARTAPYPAASSGSGRAAIVADDDEPVAPGRGPMIAAAVVAALGLGAAATWALWPSPPAEPVTAAASANPATATPRSPDDGPQAEQWLGVVNRDDVDANPIAERHALLAKLRATPIAARIDEALQVRLDLRQATDAARPCETFATALERAAQDPKTFAAALALARAPDPATTPAAGRAPDRPCEGLAARLAELRGDPPGATTAPPIETTPRPRPRKRVTPAAGASPDGPRAPIPDQGSSTKLDDELRPFRK